MSFSFAFLARTKARAAALAEDQRKYVHVPAEAVEFVLRALASLPDDDPTKLISVESSGHAHQAPQDLIQSLNTTVKRVTITD